MHANICWEGEYGLAPEAAPRSREEGLMIKNSEIAKDVSDLFLDFNGRLNESVEKVGQSCSAEEFASYRRRAAKLINAVFEAILEPIYREHPDLKPPDLEMS
jgi:hypothetical protein